MNTLKNVVIAFAVFITVNIFSQKVDNISTDRPDQTETSLTVPPGFLQVELGAEMESSVETYTTFYHPDPFTSKVKYFTAPVILARYGITKNIELRLGTEYYFHSFTDDYSGYEITQHTFDFGTVDAGAKINIVKESGLIPESALILTLLIPTKKHRDIDAEFRLTAQNSINRNLSLSYNAGTVWNGGSKEFNEYLYTISLGISLNKKTGMFAEAFGFLFKGMQPDHRLDGGFTYLFAKNIQVDISGGIGLSAYSPDYFIGAGLSVRLPQ